MANVWWADIIFTTHSSLCFIFGKLQPVIMAAMLVAHFLLSKCIPHKAHTFVHVLSSSDKIYYRMSKRLHWVSDSFMEIVPVKAVLSSGLYTNLWACFSHLLPQFGKTSASGLHAVLLGVCQLCENWHRAGRMYFSYGHVWNYFYVCNVKLLFCMGVKLGRWHWGRKGSWGC